MDTEVLQERCFGGLGVFAVQMLAGCGFFLLLHDDDVIAGSELPTEKNFQEVVRCSSD